ncbi:MFS transporter [Microbacterium hibisci]|uniref:MFS transporter n=1 Tax=Microbacterium hibisci TaxID=2036000 RepID=UPI001942AAA3|nr:MFS transporter [Microbacterium hibisci]
MPHRTSRAPRTSRAQRRAAAGGAPPLRRDLLIAFALPTVILGVMHGPEGILQGVYAKHAGISLGALAIAVLVTKLFDAFTYPLIGWLSDLTYARTGTRRSWLIAGCALSVAGVWFLLSPPDDVGVVYFGLWMAVTYLGWKVMEIPIQAWSYGLSTDYGQRARVQGWRGMAQIVGQLLFFVIPFLAMQLGMTDSTEVDFRSLRLVAIICAVALPIATLLFILRVPSRGVERPIEPEVREPRRRLRELWTAVRRNPPLLRLLAAFLPVNLLTGMSSGLTYLYMDIYLGIGAELPAIMGLALLTSIIGIPIWTALSGRFERHRVWAIALILGSLAYASFVLVSPGPGAAAASLVLLPIVTLVVSGSIAVYTMSADIVDYGRLKTGEDHSGLYGSLFAFLQKSIVGVAGALGLAFVAFCGFDATAVEQTTSAVIGLKLGFAVLPALGLLVAALIIWNYPLNRARIQEIQAELAERGELPAVTGPTATDADARRSDA